MQRSIKFRGQDFETGEWIYGSYNSVNAGAADVLIIYEKEILDPVSFGFIDTEIVEMEVKEETVGQYTGLKDKNGDKEVYECDIIDSEGNIIGNQYETPTLLEDKTNLLIQGFGTKAWLTTYQEAVARGCHDA